MARLLAIGVNLLVSILYLFFCLGFSAGAEPPFELSFGNAWLAIPLGAFSAAVSIIVARDLESPLPLYLISIGSLVFGALAFGFAHPDFWSPRYGGGSFFLLNVEVCFALLLGSFLLSLLSYWAWCKIFT